MYDFDLNLLKVYPSSTAAAKDGYTQPLISAVCNGKRLFHRGRHFSFEELEYDRRLSKRIKKASNYAETD